MKNYLEIALKALQFLSTNSSQLGRLARLSNESRGRVAEYLIGQFGYTLFQLKILHDLNKDKFAKIKAGFAQIMAGVLMVKEGWVEAKPVLVPVLKGIGKNLEKGIKAVKAEGQEDMVELMAELAESFQATFGFDMPGQKKGQETNEDEQPADGSISHEELLAKVEEQFGSEAAQTVDMAQSLAAQTGGSVEVHFVNLATGKTEIAYGSSVPEGTCGNPDCACAKPKLH